MNYFVKLSDFKKSYILFKEAYRVLTNIESLNLEPSANSKYYCYKIKPKQLQTIKYFFIAVEHLCFFEDKIIEGLYDEVDRLYLNSYKIYKSNIRFNLSNFKTELKKFINKNNYPNKGYLKLISKKKIKINELLNSNNNKLNDYNLNWEDLTDKVSSYYETFAIKKLIIISNDSSIIQNDQLPNIFKSKIFGEITRDNHSIIEQIIDKLYIDRLIARHKDLENFKKLFTISNFIDFSGIVWTKSPRLLYYVLIKLYSKNLFNNKEFYIEIRKNRIFYKDSKTLIDSKELSKAYNAASNYIDKGKPKIRHAEFIDKEIFGEDSSPN